MLVSLAGEDSFERPARRPCASDLGEHVLRGLSRPELVFRSAPPICPPSSHRSARPRPSGTTCPHHRRASSAGRHEQVNSRARRPSARDAGRTRRDRQDRMCRGGGHGLGRRFSDGVWFVERAALAEANGRTRWRGCCRSAEPRVCRSSTRSSPRSEEAGHVIGFLGTRDSPATVADLREHAAGLVTEDDHAGRWLTDGAAIEPDEIVAYALDRLSQSS